MATPPSRINRIVVGVDGSEHAAFALQWAIRMARGMGSEVTAVFAIVPPLYIDGAFGDSSPIVPPQFDPEWRAAIQKDFEDEWCKPLRESGVRYRTVMEDGRPASVVAKAADQVDADVIVVGRRGRGEAAELLLGSVSHELVLHCKRPVLVISTAPQP